MNFADPLFFPLDFDLGEDEAIFVQATPADFVARLRISALDFPIERLRVLPRNTFISAANRLDGGRNLNLLLHMPFVGSSFLTRHLQIPSIHLIRDPACIDALFQFRPGSVCRSVTELQKALLRVLNRPVSGKRILVRTAGYHPEMFRALVEASECRSALFLFSAPDVFLLQILKNSERRRDLRHLLGRCPQLALEYTGRAPQQLADGEIAGLFWVYAAKSFLALTHHDARTLDSAQLFERPEKTALLVAQHLRAEGGEILCENRCIDRVHAKSGMPFDPAMRAELLTELKVRHGEELARAQPMLDALGAADIVAELNLQRLR